jgi:RNA polymerase sigma factor (sigma-70 family)
MAFASDHELLDRYARDDDHAAFAEVVRRYVAFVYSAARRQTRGDAHLADDVTQAVMIVLARRAGTIATGGVLASWLLVVTRHCAQNALKIQSRQRIHEHRAAVMRANEQRTHSDSAYESPDDELHDALHGAIARLREQDRAGLVLHYFQRQTHQQVGEALGVTAGAARKRVERAVERVRTLLSGRGVVVTSASVVTAIMALSSTSFAVPAHLTSSAVNLAMLTVVGNIAPSTGSLAIAQGVSRMFTIAKLKAAAAVLLIGAVGVPLAGVGAWTLATVGSPEQVAASSTASPTTASADANAKFTARVTEKISVTFLGCAPHPANETEWRDITGQPIEMPDPHLSDNSVNTDGGPDQQVAMIVTAPPDTRFGLIIENSRTNSNSSTSLGDGRTLMRARFGMSDAAETIALRLAFATEPWKTVAECEMSDQPAEVDSEKYGVVKIMPAYDDARWGKGCVTVEHDPVPGATGRMIAIDDAGNRHEQKLVNGDHNDDRWTTTFIFNLPHEKIRKVILEARDFDKYVIARGISISAHVTSEPKIEVKDAEKK